MRPVRLPAFAVGSTGSPEKTSGVIRRALVVGNGCAGAENQCIGLVRALGLADRYILYRVTRPRGGINRWLQWLPISLHKRLDCVIGKIRAGFANKAKDTIVYADGRSGGMLGVFPEADEKQIAAMARSTFDKNGPLLVVASGHDTISVASSIKRLARDNVFVVQVQHPRSNLERFDLVITPRHDYYPLTLEGQRQIPTFLRAWVTPREPPGRNVFLTAGALHKADSSALRSAALAWQNELIPLPKPLVVVNIGGPTRNCFYGVDLAKQLCAMLQSVLWSCGSVRISFSRRTPEQVSEIVIKEFSLNSKVYIWNGQGPNPHMGHLALGDAFIITADSVSMLSEETGVCCGG
ncbi:PREDICTED: mitochondrial fission protein ELM1 isoform X2 [Tarenaya hassleriana]|uniref:mitochondrial fission protein ELM1 isoform X2 n=1 Tax=Tarenaya hassleriana TaxID=28532 RepID=UPI00053C62D9|nr:PREDICTED: mitochondrial fission protein ELM1 isoform X2 [Tarenaya hassleriana]